jgi:hypothetical protein
MLKPEIDKPWVDLTRESVGAVEATTGVYEIADASGRVVDVDYAGALTLFGLRGRLLEHLETADAPLRFRVEIHSQYLSRFEELLMVREADDGALPPAVLARGHVASGRMHPR